MQPPKPPELTGTEPLLFKRFRLMRKLGSGGMGIVYEALDERRGVIVALKTLRKLSPAGLMVLKREFRLASELSHPNLVRFYDMVSTGKGCGFSMELVEGQDLMLYVRGVSEANPDSTAVDMPTIDPALQLSKRMAPVAWLKETGASYDGPKLLTVMPQLCAALDAMHQSGLVHRDVKPQNVLVTRKGVAKLIDLGIAQSDDPRESSEEQEVSGTPHYMSPEQARGERVGPPSDLYSLGVLLYVLLTGRPPFVDKDYYKVLQSHLDDVPPPPSKFSAGIPKGLESLCLDLLRKDPALRPSAREVAKRLKTMGAPEASFAPQRLKGFVGRTEEISALSRLGARAKVGAPQGGLLGGESGCGKSLLCAEVVRALSELGWRVISGRCYEREFLAYNGVDPMIDAVTSVLLNRTRLGAMPADIGALATIFPAIAQLPGVKKNQEDISLAELRRRASLALRELLQLYRQEAPLVIWLDDLQWVDQESIEYLCALLREDEKPFPLLFLGTYYSSEVTEVHPLWPLLRMHAVSSIELTPFGTAEVGALLGELASPKIVEKITQEARGNAFLAAELAAAYIEREATGGDLRTLLLGRLAALESQAREVLEALSVSGSATSFDSLQRALSLDAPALTLALDQLRGKRWVREVDPAQEGDAAFDIYHNRIREVVYQTVAPSTRRMLHLAFARLLESTATDGLVSAPDVVARHLVRAGAIAEAAPWLLAAARKSAQQLAVERADELYLRITQLGFPQLPEVQPAREERAALLDRAGGRYAEAALAYREAARYVEGAAAVRLLLLAAEADLKHGEIEGALEAGTQAMAPYERLKLPSRGLWALAEAGYRSFRVERTLRHMHELPGRPFSERNALRHLLYHRLGAGLTYFDLYRSIVCNTRALSLALYEGSDDEVISALTFYSFMAALRRGRKNFNKAQSQLARCESWLSKAKDPELAPWVEGIAGMVSSLSGDYETAQEQLPTSLDKYRALGRITGYEISAIKGYWMVSFLGLGQPKMALDYMAPRFARAQAEGDLLTAFVFAPILIWCYLLVGDLDAARKVSDFLPVQGSSCSVLGVALPMRQAAILLAEQKVSAATEILEKTLSSRLFNGLILLPEYHLRTRAYLAVAYIAAGRKSPQKSARYAALWQARRALKPLLRSDDPVLEGIGFRLMGIAEATRGKEKSALHWLDKAVLSLQENGEAFELAAALLARGALRGNNNDISQGKSIIEAGGGVDPAAREGGGWSWK